MTEKPSPLLPTGPLPGELVDAARTAGIHDVDALRLADLSKYQTDHTRFFRNAADFVEAFRAEKPHLFKEQLPQKSARDMTAAEAASYIRELKRAAQRNQDIAALDRTIANAHKKPKRQF